MLGTVEFEGDRLVNGDRHGFGRGITVVAKVNGDSLSLHEYIRFNKPFC